MLCRSKWKIPAAPFASHGENNASDLVEHVVK